MAKATYMVTQDLKTPYQVSTGRAKDPIAIKWKRFKKGELIAGELKHANNKPAFILFNGVCVIPLSVVRAVVTKDILTSSASGNGDTTPLGGETTKKIVTPENKKLRYADAAIVGALVGLAGVYLAHKKAWITVPDKMNYAYGAGIGAAAALYFIYRQNNKPKPKTLT
jgi:hypothetical protein